MMEFVWKFLRSKKQNSVNIKKPETQNNVAQHMVFIINLKTYKMANIKTRGD